jgi:hypothetical protein
MMSLWVVNSVLGGRKAERMCASAWLQVGMTSMGVLEVHPPLMHAGHSKQRKAMLHAVTAAGPVCI